MLLRMFALPVLLAAIYPADTLLAQAPVQRAPVQGTPVQGTPVQGAAQNSNWSPAATNQRAMPARPSGPAQYMMNSREFDIPVTIDQSGTRPAEVRLFVSRDQGRQWAIAARGEPSRRQFQFAAPEDGVYWFATRTLDAAGNSYPVGSQLAAQLIVVVDTSIPQLELQADADAVGDVQIDYAITEAFINPASVRIFYMTDTQQSQWKPLDTDLAAARQTASGKIEHRIRFQPRDDWRYINLRFEVSDQAGNQATLTRQIERPRLAASPDWLAMRGGQGSAPRLNTSTAASSPQANLTQASSPQLAPGQLAPAGQPTHDPGQSSAVAGGSLGDAGYAMTTPLPRAAAAAQYAPPPPRPDLRGFDQQSTWSANRAGGRPLTAQPVSRGRDDGRGRGDGPTTPLPTSSAMRPLEIESLPLPEGVRDQGETVATDVERSAADFSSDFQAGSTRGQTKPIADGSANSSSGSQNLLGDSSAYAGDPLAMTIDLPEIDESEIRHTRLNRFELNYEVEAIGSRGVSAVELWGTRDGGQTWKHWGVDPDLESPFDIETNGSGLYGFCIVVVGRNGLTSPAPRSGDPAEIYIRVDTDAPTVHITAARYGEGPEAGSLIIEYQCEDEQLIKRPISLAYSESAEGPWTTIAAGLENSGRYAWPADPRLPKQLYLRIEATDRAGNVGIESTSQPIAIHGLAPRARIRSFQPIDRN